MFQTRYRHWNKQIERDEEGIALFARPRSYEGGPAAILLVHGFGDGPQVWESLAPALNAEGFTVRALRLPGWGEPPQAKQKITRQDWLQHIRDEIAELRGEYSSVFVAAHSMGGCLSALLAVRGDLDADGLILYAPMFGVSNARSPLLPTRTWFEIGDKILPDRMLVESLFPDHARVNEPRPRTRRDPFVPARIFGELYAAMDELALESARVPFPVRLVLPGKDHVIDLQTARTWYETLESPSKTLHMEDPAGHVLPLDMDPSLEARRVSEWVNSLSTH